MTQNASRMRSVWIGVTGAMALVVGFWAFSLRARIGLPASDTQTDASLTQAYEQFKKTRAELEEQYTSFRAAIRPSESAAATTTADQALLDDLKRRIEQRAER